MSVGIVGLGYVGLPLAVAFAEAGLDVVGVDSDPGKVAGIREGRSYVEDIPDDRLRAVDGRISARPRRQPFSSKVRCNFKTSPSLPDARMIVVSRPSMTASQRPVSLVANWSSRP